ncbi:hypothetical protein PanWU01x14_020970 [Parasponia andersonii]|uniref:Uncharacterized protein n=1 Tax=Parasponia andersonii TaxID=3476 RepID=A0A2P5DXU0_PARAD|nr:hypothetical protein PanWU01x14_020970 [Parasponia andersonii]
MEFFRFSTSAWMSGPQHLDRASSVLCAMRGSELAMDSV